MKEIHLGHLVKGEKYYIQTQNYKFKAVYDGYGNVKYNFKNIIHLNTPKNWCGYIGFLNIIITMSTNPTKQKYKQQWRHAPYKKY